MSDLFPRGVATGSAFYNREKEQAYLRKNIENTVHTVLIAPRRFGKTSLMNQVILENNYPHLWLDLMTMTTRDELQQKFLDKISSLILQLVPHEEKLKLLLKKYFLKLKPELIFSVPGLSLKLQANSSQQSLTDALIALDQLAQDLKKRAVIVLDEFQEIIQLEKDGIALQGSIRHAAERSKRITYLFSGSKHRPLKKLFHGKNNPLYQLCDQITLERVSAADYYVYLNKAAHQKWKKKLSNEMIEKILVLTERYPKYVNALCGSLWSDEQFPTIESIDLIWHNYLFARKTDISEDIESLTLNQKRLLRHIALEPSKELYSKVFLTKVNLSQSSVQSSIHILLDKGLIAKWESLYQVLDPTLKLYFELF